MNVWIGALPFELVAPPPLPCGLAAPWNPSTQQAPPAVGSLPLYRYVLSTKKIGSAAGSRWSLFISSFSFGANHSAATRPSGPTGVAKAEPCCLGTLIVCVGSTVGAPSTRW